MTHVTTLNIWKILTVVAGLVAVALIAILIYNTNFSVPSDTDVDVGEFIDEKGFEQAVKDCRAIRSRDDICAYRDSIEKVDAYCKTKSLSKLDCDRLQIRVQTKGLEYHKALVENSEKMNDFILRETDKLKLKQLRNGQ